ncbi:MAG: outer membrane beta-barrel protein [Xanthobacteraceae bacterium]|nr:outer membrane beta-barrel protein [Xanthobacteraceae bacterium]
MSRPSMIIGGLTAILAIGEAMATDPFVTNWSGPYFGLSAGYARDQAQFDAGDLAASGITGSIAASGPKSNGIGFGVQTGFNWQAGLLVYGIEGDWSRFRLHSDHAVSAAYPPFGSVAGRLGADLDWTTTLRARAGLAAGDAFLYATGGLAIGRASGDLLLSGFGAPVSYSGSSLLAGWVWGGGIETMFSPHWTARAEFLRMHLGSDPFSFDSSYVPVAGSLDLTTVRAGINYKF